MMICVSIIAKSTDETLEKIAKANTVADMLELRLDLMESFCLKDIIRMASKPVIATYRSKKEGGKGSADYATRTRYLWDAVEAGADFVDVEYSMPLKIRQSFFQTPRPFGVIISTHLLNGTPDSEKLEVTLRKLAATGADMVKIVTRARAPEDNLRILNLIPLAQKLGIRIITFCMGPKGRISRVASPLLGSYLTFTSLEEGDESAEGQIPVKEMRKILDILGR
jgi:3-dehydroquinate dehydratase type I